MGLKLNQMLIGALLSMTNNKVLFTGCFSSLNDLCQKGIIVRFQLYFRHKYLYQLE